MGNGCKRNEAVFLVVAEEPAAATGHVQEPAVDVFAVETADVHVSADVSAKHGGIGHYAPHFPRGS